LWAVDADDLVEAKTAALRTIAELAEQRDEFDTALFDAVRGQLSLATKWQRDAKTATARVRRAGSE
jgi:hypothetical protein